ncbi:uncharacterized protein PAC_12572 [Phialocephala subalpina]|uniref:Azaphilone pigments biosynthesis cluster protein L N-terminal domain-containing protein n=1 Tax=Phialocephala subalpina TaxID=576137 RepID=A0A1L7XCD6_9HELO|nr:uncharacterized protein PAC_12572 [Phialocephala subalpina]
MAEAIGLASGLLTLAGFAFQSSITLYQTVQSFRFHPKQLRDLKEELEALSGVLTSLTETVSAATDVDLSALGLPLLRCGNACKEFEQEILKCSSRSGGSRTSFRDWAKLRYMGDNIDGFRQLLAGYKSTINIALTDANLRKSSVTTESLEIYKALLQTATDDLEAHLQNIDEKLETIFSRTVTESPEDAAELRLIKEERMSAQKCLQICAQLSDHINQIQLTPELPITLPERLTTEGLRECKRSLDLTTAKLESYMKDRIDRLVRKSKIATTSEEDLADLARLQEEWETTRQSREICSKAETHLKENITTIDNYATGDAIQFMVSTDGNIVHGKNRGVGWKTRQVGGHLSDVSVQQLSRDMSGVRFLEYGNGGPSSRDNSIPVPENEAENNPGPEFRERYGPGFKLTPKTTADTHTPSLPEQFK